MTSTIISLYHQLHLQYDDSVLIIWHSIKNNPFDATSLCKGQSNVHSKQRVIFDRERKNDIAFIVYTSHPEVNTIKLNSSKFALTCEKFFVVQSVILMHTSKKNIPVIQK